MERKKWINMLTIVLTFALVAGFSLSARADEVSLKVAKKWGNRMAIEMENDTPILGVEFTLSNLPDVATVKTIIPTSRTSGFLTQFNDLDEEGVKVVIVSLKGKAISPGAGPILEIFYENSQGLLQRFFQNSNMELQLTGINVADANNQPVEVNTEGLNL